MNSPFQPLQAAEALTRAPASSEMRSGAACGEKAWWETRLFMALLIVGSVVPLLWPSLPPLIDLPAHLARYRVQLGLSDSP
jgi:hypothetical protein